MAIWERPEMMSGETINQTNQQVKPYLGIGIIHTHLVHINWAMSLRILNIPWPYIYQIASNAPYDVSREQIARTFMNQDIEYILWIDTDTVLPQNAATTLVQLSKDNNKPIVSGLYWAKKREPTPMPCAWIKTGEDLENGKINYQTFDIKPYLGKNHLIEVDVVGCGCLLMKKDIFQKLHESDPKKPFFQWGVGRNYDTTGKPMLQVSEDFYMLDRCNRELGIKPHLSTAVECSHIAWSHRRPQDGQLELI